MHNKLSKGKSKEIKPVDDSSIYTGGNVQQS